MINEQDLEKIKETIGEFFEKTTLEINIEKVYLEDSDVFLNEKSNTENQEEKIKTIFVELKTKEPRILIGEKGQTLFEIQQLLVALIRKKIKEQFFLSLDINEYKKKKIEFLKELAANLADEVSLDKKEKYLPSMTPYERRIIHMELSKRKDVSTESIGIEPERKIIIRSSN